MPLTPFQIEVLSVIATNRRPESHLAGGVVLNRADDSPRYSDDFDIFHDPEESVAIGSETDADSLTRAGYEIHWEMRETGFRRAIISKGQSSLRLDWAIDSAFRFFPVQQDPLFGYCLHKADLVTNKALALAGRVEARDYLDVLHIDSNYLDLGAVVWEGRGVHPDDHARDDGPAHRHRREDFDNENLTTPADLSTLRTHWQRAAERAAELFDRLPVNELGCLYLDAVGNPVTPNPRDEGFAHLTRHYGRVRGAWPTIHG